MKRSHLFLVLLAFLTISSCSNDDTPAPVQESNLIRAEFIDSRTAQEMQFLVGFSGYDLDPTIFQYDVKIYRVTYTTTYKGDEIEASGIVALPTTNTSVPVLSFQHGTMVAHNEAPSAQDENSFDLILYGAMASTGFITVVPDLIGFGESKEILHPYYVEEPTATAVIDNIRAAEKVAIDNSVHSNNRLFLAGYSQGGYATLCAHKAIEENPIEDLDLVASFPGAGGYDLKAMQEYFFSLDQYNQPYYIGYVASAYKSFYNFSSVITDLFNEPYASRIPSLYNGANAAGTINDQLTTNISQLIKSDIRTNFETSQQYSYLLNTFIENSPIDWVPENPVFLYHGTADVTVPYNNSQLTYQRLISNGASSSIVKLIPLQGADHTSGLEPYIQDVIEKLQDLK